MLFMTYKDCQSTQSTPYIFIFCIAFRMHWEWAILFQCKLKLLLKEVYGKLQMDTLCFSDTASNKCLGMFAYFKAALLSNWNRYFNPERRGTLTNWKRGSSVIWNGWLLHFCSSTPLYLSQQDSILSPHCRSVSFQTQTHK